METFAIAIRSDKLTDTKTIINYARNQKLVLHKSQTRKIIVMPTIILFEILMYHENYIVRKNSRKWQKFVSKTIRPYYTNQQQETFIPSYSVGASRIIYNSLSVYTIPTKFCDSRNIRHHSVTTITQPGFNSLNSKQKIIYFVSTNCCCIRCYTSNINFLMCNSCIDQDWQLKKLTDIIVLYRAYDALIFHPIYADITNVILCYHNRRIILIPYVIK